MQDLFHLERFLTAQEHHYATALAEIRRGERILTGSGMSFLS